MAWDRRQFLFYADVLRNARGPFRNFQCGGVDAFLKMLSEKFNLLIAVADQLDADLQKTFLEKAEKEVGEKEEDEQEFWDELED